MGRRCVILACACLVASLYLLAPGETALADGFCLDSDTTLGTPDMPRSIVAVDLDGDNDVDLATANEADYNVSIILNNGDGTFASPVNYSIGDTPSGICAGYFNEDEYIDLAAIKHNQGSSDNLVTMYNDGDGTFTYIYYWDSPDDNMGRIAAADLTDDGLDDIISGNTDHDILTEYRSESGVFDTSRTYHVPGTLAGPGKILGLSLEDIDANGLKDAVLGFAEDTVIAVLKRYLGIYDYYFASPAYYQVGGGCPASVDAADLDGDGDNDIAIGVGSCEHSSPTALKGIGILWNNGSGSFGGFELHETDANPYSVKAVDLDSDGDMDILAVISYLDSLCVLENLGDTAFATPVFYPVGDDPTFLATGDLDCACEGGLDIAVANRGSDNISILLNCEQAPYVAGDIDNDGFPTSIDLGLLIDILFAGASPPCPPELADVDCDGFITALDLGTMIDYLNSNGSACFECW